MRDDSDPLKSLIVKREESIQIARELLKTILHERVFIDDESEKIEFHPDTYNRSAAEQILLLLCGKLALKMLGFEEDEKMTQAELINALEMMEEGTVKSNLFRLRKGHFIKNEGGQNFVSLSQLQKIKSYLLQGSSENDK